MAIKKNDKEEVTISRSTKVGKANSREIKKRVKMPKLTDEPPIISKNNTVVVPDSGKKQSKTLTDLIKGDRK